MAKLSSWKFLVHQRKGAPPLQTTDIDLSGKAVLVTGATSGVGLDAAKHLARMKPSRLILACRSVARGEKVAESTFFTSYEICPQYLGLMGIVPQ